MPSSLLLFPHLTLALLEKKAMDYTIHRLLLIQEAVFVIGGSSNTLSDPATTPASGYLHSW